MKYNLLRDGKSILKNVDDNKIYEYIHNHHSFSVHWGILFEGYRITDETGTEIKVV